MTTTPTTTRYRLVLNGKAFVMCWWLVVLLHAADVAFLVAMARLNYWLLHNPFATFNLLDLLSLDISYKTLDLMNWVFVVVAGSHALALLRVLLASVRTRRLDFGGGSEIFRASCGINNRSCNRWIAAAVRMHDKHFDGFFLVQEYFEVASQIYQAYRMSNYIATRWINNLFVGMIFINSLSTPLIHRFVAESKVSLRRTLEVTMSSFLNFINSVVIPVVIFAKYVRAYEPSKYSFSDQQVFGDVWFPMALHENQQLFVTSWLDFMSTLWPHISLLNCLLTCESVLARRTRSKVKTPGGTIVRVYPCKSDVTPVTPFTMPLPTTSRSHSRTPKVRHVFYNVLWISGVVVLGIHIDAQSAPRATSCMLGSTPWFSGGKSSCVVLNINCHRLGILGNHSEIDAILKPMNVMSMDTLIISHCPRLEVPRAIRDFWILYGFEIYNTTIESWPAESAPRVGDYEFLEYIYIVLSNLTSLPEGLLQDSFPVMDIYFYGTNLTTLPSSIKDTWVNIGTLLMEYGKFEEIPAVVYDMPVDAISLAGSPVGYIDLDVFANKELFWLYLSGCPVRSLPSNTSGSLDELMRLPLEFTELEEVPSFIQEWYLANHGNVLHSLFGSPYCNKNVLDLNEKTYQEHVCAENLGTITGRYPIEVVIPQRPP